MALFVIFTLFFGLLSLITAEAQYLFLPYSPSFSLVSSVKSDVRHKQPVKLAFGSPIVHVRRKPFKSFENEEIFKQTGFPIQGHDQFDDTSQFAFNPQSYGQYYFPSVFGQYFSPLPIPSRVVTNRGDDGKMGQTLCMRWGRVGRCEDKDECGDRGGSPQQYCYSDISKNCCLYFYTQCGIKTGGNIIHLENQNYPFATRYDSSCSYTIEKGSDSCGIRITFERLKLPGESGDCNHIEITLSGGRRSSLAPLCGDLSYTSYDVNTEDTDSVIFSINAIIPKFISYRIKIEQLKCNSLPVTTWPSGENESKKKPSLPKPIKPAGVPLPMPEKEIPKPVAPMPKPPKVKPVIPVKPVVPEVKPMPPKEKPSPVDKPAEKPEEDTIMKPTDSQKTCGLSQNNPTIRDISQNSGSLFDTFFSEGPKIDESDISLSSNPFLTSDEWDVPVVNQSLLYEAAAPFLPLDGRITFGKKAQQYEFPWQIVMYNRGRFHCSGSIISKREILTAAHCVDRYKNNHSVFKLTIGDYNVKSQLDGKNIEGKIEKIFVHEGYSARALKNDIAIIRLKTPLKYSRRIQPVCLPESNTPLEGKLATVTGWGRNERNRLQPILMKHSAHIVSNQVCNQRWTVKARGKLIIQNTMMCMDPQDGDSCKGDSGGPGHIKPAGSNSYVIAGIVSFGSASCTDKQLPGVYTRVGSFLPWIKRHMTKE